MEEVVIINFIDAAFGNDSSKVNYILRGVRPELANMLTNWLRSQPFERTSSPRHPMVMPEYELLMEKRSEESQKMSAKGQEMFNAAQEANKIGDNYSLLTVMLSMVMFLGAITTKLVRTMPRLVLTELSALIFIGVMILLFFFFPVAPRID
jgi:hypothetical protein